MYQVMEVCPKCGNNNTKVIHGSNNGIDSMYNFCSICLCEWNFVSSTLTIAETIYATRIK